jgi:Zn-dependent protease with chaperone function
MMRVDPMFNELILTFAWFAAVNGLVSVATLIAAGCFRDGIAADPRRARRLVLARLAPAGIATVAAGAVFLPGHVALEPATAVEWLGPWTLALGLCGIALVIRSAVRLGQTWQTSARLSRGAGRNVRRGRLRLTEVPLLPGIALAGILRPRILIGSHVRTLLSGGELDAAVAHELAHQHAGDNFTRVLMHCAPDFLTGTPGAKRLEMLWTGEAECLADAAAVGGSPRRATRLASALVKIARLASATHEWSPEWSTLHHPPLLELRIRRLVSGAPARPGSSRWFHIAAALTAAALVCAWTIGLPTHLHWLTERLLHA